MGLRFETLLDIILRRLMTYEDNGCIRWDVFWSEKSKRFPVFILFEIEHHLTFLLVLSQWIFLHINKLVSSTNIEHSTFSMHIFHHSFVSFWFELVVLLRPRFGQTLFPGAPSLCSSQINTNLFWARLYRASALWKKHHICAHRSWASEKERNLLTVSHTAAIEVMVKRSSTQRRHTVEL